jgi:hypothetical protein
MRIILERRWGVIAIRFAVGQEALQLPQEIQERKVSVSDVIRSANEESICFRVQ